MMSRAIRRVLCTAGFVLSTTPAFAQPSEDVDAAEDGAPGPLEEVVTRARPIQDSMALSLEAQRDAVNVLNVIASDTIGRFPDKTAAAALARLPGVAVQRDQGQERFIQVRGGPAHWTQVSFDGINVLGAQDRTFRFDSVPSTLIDAIELSKTLTPDMSAEALAGRVNVRTFSPLDNPGWDAQLEAGYGSMDLGDGPQESYAGRVSWSNDRFGAMLAASHFEFEQQADNSEPRFDESGYTSLRTAKYVTIRETNAYSGKLEFQAAPGHRLSATSLYTEFKDDEQRNQYTFGLADAASGRRGFESGDLERVPVTGLFEEGDYENSTFYNVLRGDHELGAWRGQWQLAYTETEMETDLPLVAQMALDPSLHPSVSYEASDPRFPRFTIGDGLRSRLDQTAFDTEVLQYYGNVVETESYTLQGDLEREWDLGGAPSTLTFGFQADTREAISPGALALLTPDGASGSFPVRQTAAALGVPWTPLESITAKRIGEDFDRGYAWNYIDNRRLRAQLDDVLAAARAANADGAGDFAVPRHDPSQAYTIDEDILAGYVMNEWQWQRHELLAGVRIERADILSAGNISSPDPNGGPPTREPLTVENSFTDVFPSIHWNFDITDRLKYRLSGISGAARPGFSKLRANASIDDANGRISGGNPELEPETAFGADTSLEWYFASASLLAVNAFYRNVDNVLFESATTVDDDRYDFDGIERSGYELTTPLNGEDGELYGFELAYNQPWRFLPSPLDGFGVQASVSLLDGSFSTSDGREVDFPGTSDRITNLAVFYEKYGLSIRLGYQHRTDWLDDVSADAQSDIHWESTERVNLSVRYNVLPWLTLYIDGNNLTDELGIRYEGDESRPYEVEGFGRRLLFGFRANL